MVPQKSSNDNLVESNQQIILSPESQTSGWRSGITILILSTIFSLFLIEVAFRLVQPQITGAKLRFDRPSFFYLPDSKTGLAAEFPPKKDPGVYRIVVIGDSFTFGGHSQYDDAYAKRLERMLNLNEAKRKVEVLTWGVPGFSTKDELRLLHKALGHYSPDLMLLQITLNDPELKTYRAAHPELDSHGRVKLSNPIFRYWTSLAFVVRRIYNSATHKEYIRYYFDLFEKPETWSNFESSVTTFAKLCNQKNVKLFAMVFPLFSHSLSDDYPFAPIHNKVDGLLQSLNVPFLDLRKAYYKMDPARLQALPNLDSHPNEIAHRIAADELYRSLTKGRIVPDDIRISGIKKRRMPLTAHHLL